MQVIPVLDLMQGVVVRGVGGRREEYRPIVSTLVDGFRPLEVARAFRDQLGLNQLYVADLDAILGDVPNWDTYGLLLADGFELRVDAGVRDLGFLRRVIKSGVQQVILGSETLSDLELIRAGVQSFGGERLTFSLDLKQGVPLRGSPALPAEPLELAVTVLGAGIQELIVLDLASVGIGTGLSTVELCRQIHAHCPSVQLITGGGIRDGADLEELQGEPISGVLIASALHTGSIGVDEIQRGAAR